MQVNLHSIHNEKSFWGDPDVFRPERHIGHDGKLIRTDHFIPFGIGRVLVGKVEHESRL